jgi:hypothetical protein
LETRDKRMIWGIANCFCDSKGDTVNIWVYPLMVLWSDNVISMESEVCHLQHHHLPQPWDWLFCANCTMPWAWQLVHSSLVSYLLDLSSIQSL